MPQPTDCCNASLYLMCLMENCLSGFTRPELYFDVEHHYPPSDPVNVFVYLHADSTEMAWYDKRKVIDKRYVVMEKNETNWLEIEETTWFPPLVKKMQNMDKGHTGPKSKTRLVVSPEGQLIYTEPMLIKINCVQKTNDFPFEQYTCGQSVFLNHGTDKTFYYSEYAIEGITGLQNHNLVSFRTRVIRIDTFLEFKYEFKITRDSPKAVLTFVIPSIVLSILDAGMYILGATAVHQATLIPAFLSYLKYVDTNMTNYDWYPTATFLYSRYMCSIILLSWRISTYIAQQTSKSKSTSISQKLQNDWKKRFAAVAFITTFIYASISVLKNRK